MKGGVYRMLTNILSPIKQKRKKEHTGGKPQQTEKAEAVEKPETKGKR